MEPVKEDRSKILIIAGMLGAFTTSLCCIGPLVLTVLGISGAASLARFEVVRAPMILLVAGIFFYAGMSLFRKRNSCVPGSICADPVKYKRMQYFYFLGLIIAILAMTSPYWVVWLLG